MTTDWTTDLSQRKEYAEKCIGHCSGAVRAGEGGNILVWREEAWNVRETLEGGQEMTEEDLEYGMYIQHKKDQDSYDDDEDQ